MAKKRTVERTLYSTACTTLLAKPEPHPEQTQALRGTHDSIMTRTPISGGQDVFRSGRKIFLVAHDGKHGAATDKSESGAGRPWPTAALEEGIETFRGVQPNRADTTMYSTADNPSVAGAGPVATCVGRLAFWRRPGQQSNILLMRCPHRMNRPDEAQQAQQAQSKPNATRHR
ncbi:hypothetical protein BKA56DRAFT_613695 [Ilyonectria sp. MPI-CAGE-AT-0026]|nr:hypothetical protein BKA56DRAFT_613695 [Ilyonectria sp. MPI-CAGE-AT-0026]